MGIFSRIADILKANINDLIDRAEDPEKMARQIIRELQEDVRDSVQALGKAKASENMAKRQYDTAMKTSADWELRAKAALQAGNPDMAKKALAAKVRADENAEQYRTAYEQISAQTNRLSEQVDQLKEKLREAESRQAVLIARSRMAKTQKDLAASIGGFDDSSAVDKFNRLEEKVAREEAEAAAFSELSGAGDADEEKSFAQMEQDMKVDAELQRLMAEMAQEQQAQTEGGES